MIMTLFCLLQVTKGTVYSTQIIVTMCHIDVFRSKIFQTNGKCTIMIIFCVPQVSKIIAHSTQIIVSMCHIDMFRSELL